MFGRRSKPDDLERCPACGQRVEDPETQQCALCGFKFDQRITSADVTPYSQAYEEGEPARFRMIRWLWLARTERLKHLGLMRSSRASRHFAWWNVFIIALALAAYEFSRVGWIVVDASANPAHVPKPVGAGWVKLASSAAVGFAARPMYLWWNAAQSLIGAALGFIAALALAYVLWGVVTLALREAHRGEYRAEGRMSAALLYSTGFFVPAALGALVMVLRPLAYYGSVHKRPWAPSETGLLVLAGICMGVPTVFWWFWMIRLGSTAPASTRGRVLTFMIVGLPLVLASGVLAWNTGLDFVERALFSLMRLNFA